MLDFVHSSIYTYIPGFIKDLSGLMGALQ